MSQDNYKDSFLDRLGSGIFPHPDKLLKLKPNPMNQSKYDNESFDLLPESKTAPYVEMPKLEISPETEVYLRNTSYLSLINDHEAALHLLRDSARELRKAYPEQTHGLIYNIEQFLNDNK